MIEHRADLAGGDLDQEPVTGALPLCKTLAWAKQWVVVEGVVLEHSSLPRPGLGRCLLAGAEQRWTKMHEEHGKGLGIKSKAG